MAKRATAEQLVLGRRKPSRRQQSEIENDLLLASSKSQKARATLRAMLAGRNKDYSWEGVRHLPPGSLLETVCAAFQHGTDIPLELPLFTTLGMVASHLLTHEVTIDLRGQEISPAIWTILLAPSGTGKTFTVTQTLNMCAADLKMVSDSASAAKWIENLAEANGGLWIKDEIGQYLKTISEQTHMAEIKEYLLATYDSRPISRNTKQNTITIEKPRMVVLGYTVDETWSTNVPAESMLDGFAQRFNYVFAKRRTGELRPLYDLSPWRERVRAHWQKLEALQLHDRYHLSNDAIAAYEEAFKRLIGGAGASLPVSFTRRVLFSAIRYALLYHIILGKTEPVIDAVDMGWSARLIERHLRDGCVLLDGYGASELEKKVRKVEDLLKLFRSRNATLTPRDIIRNIAGIQHVSEARAVYQLILEGDESATEEELLVAGGGRRERTEKKEAPRKPKLVHSA